MAVPPMGPNYPPSETLFVTGLPMNTTNDFAKSVFGQYGIVKDANVLPIAPGKTAAAAFVEMNTVDDAKWIVENVNGNVPQSLTTPVTCTFALPKADRLARKGKGKGMDMGMGMGMGGGMGGGIGGLGALGGLGGLGGKGGPDAAKGALMLLLPLVGALAGAGGKGGAPGTGGAPGMGGGWGGPRPVGYNRGVCRYYENGQVCPRGEACTFSHGELDAAGGGGGMALGKGAPTGYKTQMCPHYPLGRCTFGEACKFAHTEGELNKTA